VFFFSIICFVLHVEIFSFAGQIHATVVHMHISSCLLDVSPVRVYVHFNSMDAFFLLVWLAL